MRKEVVSMYAEMIEQELQKSKKAAQEINRQKIQITKPVLKTVDCPNCNLRIIDDCPLCKGTGKMPITMDTIYDKEVLSGLYNIILRLKR